MPTLPPRRLAILAAAFLTLSATAAAAQDVQAGITAWQSGDYPRAITTWRPLAEAGDADAQFNLGQAYRLGRGVPQNLSLAEQWFERAARQRHEQAGAALGLLLFQNGRAREAMPWIQAAAMRGDPRAQYVFGTALFNGDILRRDLPRAYALMSVAASQGFPQAQTQLGEMERQLGPEDKARGVQIAAEMRAGAGAPVQVADAGPRPDRGPRPARPGAGASYAPRPNGDGPPPREPGPRPDGPGAGTSYAPPRDDDRPDPGPQPRPDRPSAGVSYASPETGDGDRPGPGPRPNRPAAGTSYAPPSSARDRPARVVRHDPPAPHGPPPRARPSAPPTRVADRRPPVPRTPAPAPARAAGGGWRVQLGAFAEPGNARRRWQQASRLSAIHGLSVSYVRAGALTRVVAGPLASRAAAERVCSAVRGSGGECVPVTP